MIETIVSSGEFDRKHNREIEKKYLPIFPEQLDKFRSEAMPIEQLYLSHPDEPFNLRLRETLKNGELIYTATLKDKGILTPEGLNRLEVETMINASTYAYYKCGSDLPLIRKLRAEPFKNVSIDWFEDNHVHIESEHPISWSAFLEHNGLAKSFVDVTGERIADNEWRAHFDYRQSNNGSEALLSSPDLEPELIAKDIWKHQLQNRQTIATIAGRSGSGKSTVVREIESHLKYNGVRTLTLSTDDYHRGKSWLENYNSGTWTEWDAPIVYDIEALLQDIKQLENGTSIAKRYFDFSTEEPIYDGVIESAPVILVEGIYARHTSFDTAAHFRYELPTPLATCIGRRLLRDLQERPQFADAEKSLRYMLEHAEPAYRG